MNPAWRNSLEQRHDYPAWRGRTSLSENLFIWHFFLVGNEVPGFTPHRIQRIESQGAPPFVRSLWQEEQGGQEGLLRLDVYECKSRVNAHDFLIEVLGQFQSPLVARHEGTVLGDVAFTGGAGAVTFARGNLVVLLGNAGRKTLPIQEVALRLDERLCERPRLTPRYPPEISLAWGLAPPFQAGTDVPLGSSATDPLGKPIWYKFFSSPGELTLEEGRLVYHSASPGAARISVYAITADARVAEQEWNLTIE